MNSAIIKNSQTDVESMLDLSKWLRNYNKTAVDKVNYIGIDCQYNINELYYSLKDYLQTINNKVGSSAVDSIISILQLTDVNKIKDMAHSILKIIDSHEEELSNIFDKDLTIITFYFRSLLKAEIKNEYNYYE